MVETTTILKSIVNRFLIPSERVWIKGVDVLMNIDTVPPAGKAWLGDSNAPYLPAGIPTKRLYTDGTPYSSPDYLHLWRICRMLKVSPDDVLYDLGCGMGRILCVMARQRIRKCVGVELYPSLCEVARDNAMQVKGRKAPIEIVCGDAATADLSDGTIYFMFNPFGTETLRQVLSRIEASRADHDRPIAIVYYNSVHPDLLDSRRWLKRIDGFSTFTGRSVTIWGNRLWEERKSSQGLAHSKNLPQSRGAREPARS
jgi:SAM-dependent methyltransferase